MQQQIKMPAKVTISYAVLSVTFIIMVSSVKSSLPGDKISLSVPKLSEEEMNSNHMPDHLKCDACLGVSYQITQGFEKADEKKGRGLKEYEIIEILENICDTAFEEYGVKQVDGVNRLSGPGLEAQNVMGMTQMGGKWPVRLQQMCHSYVGETEEMKIYKSFKSERSKGVKNLLCYGTGLNGYCSNYVSTHVNDEL